MSTPTDTVAYHRHDRLDDALWQTFVDVHKTARADKLMRPFYRPDRFAARLEQAAATDGWAAVVAYAEPGTPSGFAYGTPLPTGGDPSVFLIDDLVTLAPESRAVRGLHDALVSGRREHRLVILAEPDAPMRHIDYRSLGYTEAGPHRTDPDGPEFVTMIQDRA